MGIKEKNIIETQGLPSYLKNAESIQFKATSSFRYYIWIVLMTPVVIVFTFVSVSYGISASIGKQNAELSIQLSKNRKEAGKADDKERNRNKLYSKMTAAVDRDAIYAFDRIVVSLPSEIRLTSAVAQSDILTVEGVFESSDALSETMKSISRQAFVEDIEASRIDIDSKGNRIFTLKIWLR